MSRVLVIGYSGFSDGLALSRMIEAVAAAGRESGRLVQPLVLSHELPPSGVDAAIIGGFIREDYLQRLRKCSLRLIGRWPQNATLGLPVIAFDEAAYGRLGARHLAERVPGELWFLGRTRRWWGRLRADGFAEICAALGRTCRCVEVDEAVDGWDPDGPWPDLEARLAELPGGSGILCANDRVARSCLVILERLGRRVPDEVQMLGIDDDAIAQPSGLSSIQHPWNELGEAHIAFLLGRDETVSRLIPPTEIAERSTTASQGTGAIVQRFLGASRRDPGLTIAMLVRELRCSRRYLEMATARHLGVSPAAWLRSQRLDRAAACLADGGSRSAAMRAAGYRSRSAFHRALTTRLGKRSAR